MNQGMLTVYTRQKECKRRPVRLPKEKSGLAGIVLIEKKKEMPCKAKHFHTFKQE